MEVLNNADGSDAPVRDAPYGAWVIKQDLNHLSPTPDFIVNIFLISPPSNVKIRQKSPMPKRAH